jgi:cytochrome c peroxidase
MIKKENFTQALFCRRIILLATLICACFFLFSASVVQSERISETSPHELSYPANFGNRFTIPENNPLTKEGIYLGRMLFFEEKLSANNKISCGTCHQQKLAFTDGRAFSPGVDGTPTKRSSMSLANLLWVRNLFWDGRSSSLEDQSIVPLTEPHEMGQSLEASSKKLQQTKTYPPLFKQAFGTSEVTGERISKAIAQFERTLISANSKYDQYLRGEYAPTKEELNGLTLFSNSPQPKQKIRGANCAHCHGTPKTFIELFHNNGLDSVHSDLGRESITKQSIDRGRFRVPTLRNIGLTAPYMHDGRFKTLEEVLSHYSDHVKQSETLSPFVAEATNETDGTGLNLTTDEKRDIVSFLNMLTDQDFINNSEFSDPEEVNKKQKKHL